MKKSNFINVFVGTNFSSWIKLLGKNRFCVSLKKIPIALLITIASFFNTLLFWIEYAVLGFWISKVKIKDPPVFIIGHWRSGTTLVHELLSLDRRHVCPSNYECFAANHFLLTGWLFKPFIRRLLPDRRPQDNMKVDLDLPQEDECALACLGAASPYMHFLFPDSRESYCPEYDIEKLNASEQVRWQKKYLWFVKRVLYHKPGRLVSKSPTHTFRIKTLLKLFPDARFVHVYRNPYHVIRSTLNLYRTVYHAYRVGSFTDTELEDFVLNLFLDLNKKLDETKGLIPEGNYHEVRYEDLIADPGREIERVYEGLALGDYEPVLHQALTSYFSEHSDYKTNRLEIDSELCRGIDQKLSGVINRYGYDAGV